MGDNDDQSILTGWERIALAVVFLGLVITSGFVVARLGSPGDGEVVGPSSARPSVADDVPRPVSLLDAYDIVAEWSETWHPDSWPILVSAQLEFPLDDQDTSPVPSGGAYIFSFAAPENDEWARLSLAVGRQSGTIYHEEEFSSPVEPPESIDERIRNLPMSADEAFRVADEVVGQAYREGCAASRRQVQVILDTTDQETTSWVVVYFDMREQGVNDIVVRIDANTGATTAEERDDTSCEMEG